VYTGSRLVRPGSSPPPTQVVITSGPEAGSNPPTATDWGPAGIPGTWRGQGSTAENLVAEPPLGADSAPQIGEGGWSLQPAAGRDLKSDTTLSSSRVKPKCAGARVSPLVQVRTTLRYPRRWAYGEITSFEPVSRLISPMSLAVLRSALRQPCGARASTRRSSAVKTGGTRRFPPRHDSGGRYRSPQSRKGPGGRRGGVVRQRSLCQLRMAKSALNQRLPQGLYVKWPVAPHAEALGRKFAPPKPRGFGHGDHSCSVE
jgi:hypothetical protein